MSKNVCILMVSVDDRKVVEKEEKDEENEDLWSIDRH